MKRNIKRIILSILIIGITIAGGFLFSNRKEIYINHVLQKEEYSYLPKEAKNLVKEVYEETGNVVATEKNKEENAPYLNPKYIEYLSLSPKQQKDVEIIPEPYRIDYDYRKVSSGDYPSSYDLRNVNNNSYITPLKNQGSLGICWAFSATEQAESLLMKKNGQPYNSNSKVFSARQMDYAISNNGIKDFTNTHGFRELTDGANFYMSSEIMSYGLSLTDESYMPFNESTNKKELSEVLSFTTSNYEVNETSTLPNIDQRFYLDYEDEVEECSNNYYNTEDMNACIANIASELKEAYIDEIKNGIKNYGGVIVETTSPSGRCGFRNSDNKYVVENNSTCFSASEGHAMHVIGWDDDYEYSYCKKTQSSPTVNGTCSTGTLVEGRGAFLVRNSWGTNDLSYIYLTYDSINADQSTPTFYYIKDMSATNTRSWDNVYAKALSYEDSFYLSARVTQSFNKKINGSEKLEKIKFNTLSADGTYSVSIVDGNQTYNYNQVITTSFPGIYTIDLSNKNIVLNNDSFTITINANANKYYAIKDSISVFTSNVSKTPIIDNPGVNGFTIDKGTEINQRIYSRTKNIPSGATLNYSLKKITGEDMSNYLTVTNNVVAENEVNAYVVVSSTLPIGQYLLVQSYNGVEEEINLDVTGPQANVVFYSNFGNNQTYTQVVTKGEPFQLRSNTFERTGYVFTGWNTNSAGTGTSYSNNATITEGITSNISLYAQWRRVKYYIQYNANGGQGSVSTQTLTYGVSSTILSNGFTKTGYKFVNWNTKADGSGTTYTPNQSVSNLTNEDESTITLFAQWNAIQYTVKFDANGGTGSMSNQQFAYNVSTAIRINSFTRVGYTFKWWTTNKDGSGTKIQNNGQVLNLTSTDNAQVTLYAQWEAISYTITFDANGGTGSMNSINGTYDTHIILPTNTFQNEGYNFLSWNTQADGKGDTYIDGQEMTITNDTTLYAIWSRSNGSITFNSNDEQDQYKVQEFNFNEDTILEENTFQREGYVFKKWNTKKDGTGTSYEDKQTINVSDDLVLYAQWVAEKYTITFNMNGTNLTRPANMTISSLEPVVLPNIAPNDYYNFLGWYKNALCTIPFNDKYLTSNVTLYADYTKKIGKLKIQGIGNKYYTGKNITQSIKIYDNYLLLSSGYDYTVTYSNNKNIGLAKVVIKGKNNYSSSITKSFKIIPRTPTISKVTSTAKKSATIQYNKIAGGVYYQVAYRSGKTWKTFNTTGNKVTKKIFGSKKTYYFRVRAYKKVNGSFYFSSWSNTKKIKIK